MTAGQERLAKVLFAIWVVLLIPWAPFAMLVGMAFDAGYTLQAYLAVTCVWTYPVSVFIAWHFKDRWFPIVLLPLLNVAPILAAAFHI